MHGYDEQLIIRDLVESYGLRISTKHAPGNICAVSTLEYIYENYGFQTLNRTLLLIISTWEGDVNSFSSNIMKAVAKVISVYGDKINDEIFKEKVGAVSVKTLTRTAKERRPGSMGFAEAIVITYNGKVKTNTNRLFMNKLYMRDGNIFKDIEDEENDQQSEVI
ncbi:MAG: hypothetical protein E7514_07410 [Ruminococcaceae bacterium]|nr:hypothetical protein [Oscillospiraceae bacterium]